MPAFKSIGHVFQTSLALPILVTALKALQSRTKITTTLLVNTVPMALALVLRSVLT